MPNDVASLSRLSLWLREAQLDPPFALLVGSCSMDLLFPPLVACCSTHTTSRGGVQGWRSAQEGPWSCCFSVALAATLVCSWGCSVTRQGIFRCLHCTSIKGFKKGAQTLSLPGKRAPTRKWKQWRGIRQAEEKRKGHSLRRGSAVGDSVHM